ncbi:MAG: hypothetical protein KAH15_05245, partial [Candidatus Marinimicrobia bacterium]|nr:hypothetical protein [Candidatus Neomarinimicrobiota bacterium]
MKIKRIIATVFAFMFIFSALLVAEPVKVIAVHYGNPDYAEALTRENYPGFEFYKTDGSEWRYQIENTLYIGINPSHLSGYYGEIPEKMGFSASYATIKGLETPYNLGIIYLIGSNGVIATHTGPYAHFSDELYAEEYRGDFNNLKKVLKNLKKNKLPKVLDASKQVYFKSTPIGEYEPYKKTKIDKKGAGIVGWNVPDVCVYDDDGEKHQLPELVKDENCFLVFYSMNAIHKREGKRKDGAINKEWYEEIPIDVSKEMLAATQNAQKTETVEDVKNLFKSMLKATAENMNSFYEQSVLALDMAKSVNESVK